MKRLIYLITFLVFGSLMGCDGGEVKTNGPGEGEDFFEGSITKFYRQIIPTAYAAAVDYSDTNLPFDLAGVTATLNCKSTAEPAEAKVELRVYNWTAQDWEYICSTPTFLRNGQTKYRFLINTTFLNKLTVHLKVAATSTTFDAPLIDYLDAVLGSDLGDREIVVPPLEQLNTFLAGASVNPDSDAQNRFNLTYAKTMASLTLNMTADLSPYTTEQINNWAAYAHTIAPYYETVHETLQEEIPEHVYGNYKFSYIHPVYQMYVTEKFHLAWMNGTLDVASNFGPVHSQLTTLLDPAATPVDIATVKSNLLAILPSIDAQDEVNLLLGGVVDIFDPATTTTQIAEAFFDTPILAHYSYDDIEALINGGTTPVNLLPFTNIHGILSVENTAVANAAIATAKAQLLLFNAGLNLTAIDAVLDNHISTYNNALNALPDITKLTARMNINLKALFYQGMANAVAANPIYDPVLASDFVDYLYAIDTNWDAGVETDLSDIADSFATSYIITP